VALATVLFTHVLAFGMRLTHGFAVFTENAPLARPCTLTGPPALCSAAILDKYRSQNETAT
jgi:hypothetical protein